LFSLLYEWNAALFQNSCVRSSLFFVALLKSPTLINKFLHTLREKIPLGYSFADDREASLLVFINYFITVIFLVVVLIIYLIEDELLPATYRYHTVVLLGILKLWFLRNIVDAMEAEKNKGRKPYTRISVLNSGPSIPEKDLKHLFDPFFSSRDPGAGVGLGLSISYMIIKEHGGLLEVSNEDEMVRCDATCPPGQKQKLKPDASGPPGCYPGVQSCTMVSSGSEK